MQFSIEKTVGSFGRMAHFFRAPHRSASRHSSKSEGGQAPHSNESRRSGFAKADRPAVAAGVDRGLTRIDLSSNIPRIIPLSEYDVQTFNQAVPYSGAGVPPAMVL